MVLRLACDFSQRKRGEENDFKHVTRFDESEARVFCDRAITKTFAFEIFESCSLELGVSACL